MRIASASLADALLGQTTVTPGFTSAVAPWKVPTASDKAKTRRSSAYAYSRSPQEWLPRPYAGRIYTEAMVKKHTPNRQGDDGDGTIYLQIVPGPERTYQLVRVALGSPVARGFRTQESARAWVARAIRQGVLPQGVIVVEPPPLLPE